MMPILQVAFGLLTALAVFWVVLEIKDALWCWRARKSLKLLRAAYEKHYEWAYRSHQPSNEESHWRAT